MANALNGGLVLQVQADVGDIGSIADGAWYETADIDVPGAQLGDFVVATYLADLAGLMCTGYVRAAGKVRVVFFNKTGGPVDLPWQYARVRVISWA